MCKLQIMKCYQFCLCRVRHAVVNYCKFSILEYFHGLLEQLKTNFQTNFRFKRVLLVSVRHVGAHPDELQHGISIQSSINLGTTFPRISRIRIIPSTQILERVFVYLPPFISQILDIICRMVLISILIYFEWRDTVNQQLN